MTPRHMWRRGLAPLLLASLATVPARASAQDVERVPLGLLQEVMPGADRFERAEGVPPVKRAFHGDELVGFVFLTSDVPPEEYGYSGTIRAVVGVTPDGVLTGVRVTDYRESRRYEWGDFLSDPYFIGQFAGKRVGEQFWINHDIDGIVSVTISVRALTRGVRDAARRVAIAYSGEESDATAPVSDEELASMTWFDMRERGVAPSLRLEQRGKNPVAVSLVELPNNEFGAHMVGRVYGNVLSALERRGGADHLVLYVAEGTGFQPPLQEGWSIEQGGQVVSIPSEDVVSMGTPGGGVLVTETSQAGVLMLDAEDVDFSAPMTINFDRGRPELGVAGAEFWSRAARSRAADSGSTASEALSAPATAVATAPSTSASSVESAPVSQIDASTAVSAATVEPAAAPVADVSFDAVPEIVFSQREEEGSDGLLSSDSWPRVGWITLVLGLAVLAFASKSVAIRWISLATTMIVLGWIDGGFLSISHVTGLIWVGPSAIASDLPLLMMVAATLIGLVLWGRVFCGYLCPFGALQDFITRLVPARFQRELPKRVHRVALRFKYVVLGVILLPAIAGSHASLYQYFEPFGTVFFLAKNPVLWAIAGSILGAAAVIPRFYCRYACPLGAALAVGSVVTLRRIPRVEQCGHCKVCEQRCPTGAIDGPALDFKECVRCSDCEAQLSRQTGVCRHEMEALRPRLVQMKKRPAGVTGGA